MFSDEINIRKVLTGSGLWKKTYPCSQRISCSALNLEYFLRMRTAVTVIIINPTRPQPAPTEGNISKLYTFSRGGNIHHWSTIGDPLHRSFHMLIHGDSQLNANQWKPQIFYQDSNIFVKRFELKPPWTYCGCSKDKRYFYLMLVWIHILRNNIVNSEKYLFFERHFRRKYISLF